MLSHFAFIFVRRRGLEPPYPCECYHLKVVRLPVSPPAHVFTNPHTICEISQNFKSKKKKQDVLLHSFFVAKTLFCNSGLFALFRRFHLHRNGCTCFGMAHLATNFACNLVTNKVQL